MQHADTYIASLGLALGKRVTPATAQAAGLLTARQASLTTQRAICVANSEERLASDAATDALTTAHVDLAQLGPVYHAANPPVENDRFNSAATVMRQLGIETSSHPAVTVTNGDQGVIDALGTAAQYLAGCAPDGPTHALITAGGVWSTACPRWNESLPLSDGAGALVVTKQPQKGRLVATATRTHPRLAELRSQRRPVHSVLEPLFHDVLLDVLKDAGIEPSEIAHLITPFGSDRIEHAVALPQSGVDRSEFDRVVDCGRNIGYLGAADLIAGMEHGAHRGPGLKNGIYVLLLASGITSVGAAVIELRWPRDEVATR